MIVTPLSPSDNNQIQVQLINHACVLLEAGPVKLLCDPWLTGSCFNDGWDLIVDNELTINDLDFTHIWISHEHPDHFSPKDLKDLASDRRKKVRVFYQDTQDKKVKTFCESLGFSVTELRNYERFEITDGVSVSSATNRGSDSWLLFETRNQRVLNMNDCFVNDEAELKRIKCFVGELDLLMAQFSFANWVGNEDDKTTQQLVAKMILNIFVRESQTLSPRLVLPFANFTWFSNEENVYLNDFASEVADAVRALTEKNICSLVLAPLQKHTLGNIPNNENALLFWNNAYNSLENKPRRGVKRFSLSEVQQAFEIYRNRIKQKNSWWAILYTQNLGFLPSSFVYLKDLQCAVQFDITEPMREVQVSRDDCAVEMSSDSLQFLLRNEWGRGTLQINGRFKANYKLFVDFIRQSQIAFANNIGLTFPETITPLEIISPRSFVLRVAEGKAHLHL